MTEENGTGPIIATAEPVGVVDHGSTIADLDRRIREMEAAIGDLRSVKAQAKPVGRKTVAAAQVSLLAKSGEPAQEASVEDALRSLSVEQRIAVKSGLLRAGLLR